MDDRHRDVALFRYSLIREAADPALTKAERGQLVRALAAREHTGPAVSESGSPGTPWTVGSGTGGLVASTPWSRRPGPRSRPRLLQCWTWQ